MLILLQLQLVNAQWVQTQLMLVNVMLVFVLKRAELSMTHLFAHHPLEMMILLVLSPAENGDKVFG
jgi:hypothetical protein